MTKKKPYQRKFKDGEHNYHIKSLKETAFKKGIRLAKEKLNTLNWVDAFCLIATGYALAVATWMIFVDQVCY